MQSWNKYIVWLTNLMIKSIFKVFWQITNVVTNLLEEQHFFKERFCVQHMIRASEFKMIIERSAIEVKKMLFYHSWFQV